MNSKYINKFKKKCEFHEILLSQIADYDFQSANNNMKTLLENSLNIFQKRNILTQVIIFLKTLNNKKIKKSQIPIIIRLNFDLIIYVILNQYFSNNIFDFDQKFPNQLITNKNESKNLDYRLNSLNIFNIEEKNAFNVQESLKENDSFFITGSKQNKSFRKKNESEIDNLFVNFELTQSLILEKNKDFDNLTPEEEKYLPNKSTFFDKLFRRTTKIPTIIENEADFKKISRFAIAKLQDDEILDILVSKKTSYLINLWQNLPTKEKY